jgi:ABC-2 type transport system ATP-binding protein
VRPSVPRVRYHLNRLLAGPARKALAAVAVIVIIAAVTIVVHPRSTEGDPGVHVENETIMVAGGPGVPGRVGLDASLYVPNLPGPLPAIIMAHGFGGSKDTIAEGAYYMSTQGYVVLAYSARGFGHSTGQIALDSLDYEVPDARALVTWLSGRPEVLQDGPGDPRVGVTGSSYGGALALMLAATDKRVDVVAPLITWNDLSTALFPNAADVGGDSGGTPARVNDGGDGVFKRAWAAALLLSVVTGSGLPTGTVGPGVAINSGGFGIGSSSTRNGAPARGSSGAGAFTGSGLEPAGCGRLMLSVCAAYSQAAQGGRESAILAALLHNSSPATVLDKITAPTLLLQGEHDTLFGLDQADANARAIAAAGTTVALGWYDGGHDGGGPDPASWDRIGDWFSFYLKKSGTKPASTFTYSVDGPLSDTGAVRSRTLQADSYPGLAGSQGVAKWTIGVTGDSQTVLNPAGGTPAGISTLPGLSGVQGTLLGNFANGLPGQVARFTSAPFSVQTVITGTPRISVTVASLPVPNGVTGSASSGGAVLYASMSKVGVGGVRTLAGNAVAPLRIAGLSAGGAARTVRVDLPAVSLQVEAGTRVEIDFSTTDQAYAGPISPAVYVVSLTGGRPGQGEVTVPGVGGIRVSTGDVPIPMLFGAITIAVVGAVSLFLAGHVRRPRRKPGGSGRADEPSGIAADPVAANRTTGPAPLVITSLAKSYPGGVAAVTDVSFRVDSGQVVGLLGPNGAGKTTTLRMVMGLITPTDGEVRVFGRLIRPGAEVLSRIGCFVEGSGFLPHLSGKVNLDLYWRGTGRARAAAHMDEALEIAGLGNAINRKVRTYSQGMRQRLAIAQAMLGLPDLLLLDEPTNGLDPPQIHAMREVLRGYAATGRTVLISSHMLSEVEQTCSQVVVVHLGRTIAAGSVAEMVAASGEMVFSVDAAADAVRVLRNLPGIGAVSVDDQAAPTPGGPHSGVVRADLHGVAATVAVAALVNSGIGVIAAAPRNRLEDVFLTLVGSADLDTTGMAEP